MRVVLNRRVWRRLELAGRRIWIVRGSLWKVLRLELTGQTGRS
jgi:hypothetical protein